MNSFFNLKLIHKPHFQMPMNYQRKSLCDNYVVRMSVWSKTFFSLFKSCLSIYYIGILIAWQAVC